MDPFEEFARAVASGKPEKISTPETDPELLICERCGEDIAGKSYETSEGGSRFCEKCYNEREFLDNEDEKKSRNEELEEYENDYVGRVIELATKKVEKARAEIESTDEKVEVNRTKPRKVSDIHILTREEVEKARAEIEIIKSNYPNRKSQKTIPTQATILSAGITLDDCYVILGVDQFITCDELKDQFRKLSVKYNSSIGMLSRTKEENEIIGKVHTRINQAYTELDKAHKCRG